MGNGSINDINVNFEEEDTEEGVQISAICNAVPVNVDTTKNSRDGVTIANM